jgi:hypothetical protein
LWNLGALRVGSIPIFAEKYVSSESAQINELEHNWGEKGSSYTNDLKRGDQRSGNVARIFVEAPVFKVVKIAAECRG